MKRYETQSPSAGGASDVAHAATLRRQRSVSLPTRRSQPLSSVLRHARKALPSETPDTHDEALDAPVTPDELLGDDTAHMTADESDGDDDLRINMDWARVSVPVGEGPPVAGHVRRYMRERHEPTIEDYFHSRGRPMLRWGFDSIMFKLWSFALITISWHALAMVCLSVSATLLFYFYNIVSDLPISIMASAGMCRRSHIHV